MPDDSPDGPVFGDEVITIPIEEIKEMPIVLGETISELLLTETAANVQASNRNTRGGFDAGMVALAASIGQNFNELGTLEGRANAGVLATPIASPTTQQG
jgi:hypothetical protein